MSTYNGLFMRDSISDDGTVPSPGYIYSSPDIICHEQVADPQAFFKDNYNSDPNQPVQYGSAVNFIYSRVKNLSTDSKAGYINVYRSKSSLFMKPSIWKNNRLQTINGTPYLTLNSINPNQIGVGNDPFVLSALKNNLFCVVGIVSSEQEPALPDDFSTYSDFVLWIRNNQNICVRNLSLARDYPARNYERLDSFSNPEDIAVPTLFKLTATNLPRGTSFGVKCAPLNINKSQNVDQGTIFTDSGMCPANFDGTVTTFATLPSGTTVWPDNARLEIEVYVGLEENDPAIIYAESWELFVIKPHEMKGLKQNGSLVRIGSCATQFINQ